MLDFVAFFLLTCVAFCKSLDNSSSVNSVAKKIRRREFDLFNHEYDFITWSQDFVLLPTNQNRDKIWKTKKNIG